MGTNARHFWQCIALASYVGVFALLTTEMELEFLPAAIVGAVIFAYALGAQAFPVPWRYALSAVPWLVVSITVAYYASTGGLDCGTCEGGEAVGWIGLAAWLLFAGVIVAGPAVAIGRWRRRR
jgi:hypothetical protein